ncbi:MAG: DUF4167 domain-containing protein [Rhodospirillaceae bacterium]
MRQGPNNNNNNRRSRSRGGSGGGSSAGGGSSPGGGGSSSAGGGNNPNRRPNVPLRHQTYDSNGPDVRIRGNAFQVYEKYLALSRDANSSGDRIAAESYLQHAEHYVRIINQINEAAGDGQRNRPSGPNGRSDGPQPHLGGGGGPEGDEGPDDGDGEASVENRMILNT